ncbi:major facilitator superfamily domain-containing protein [Fennellomyces sp. T-0311]|nr:major facilitator superfamily domain-containing protein [Fennellomyces sp. T-0311]
MTTLCAEEKSELKPLDTAPHNKVPAIYQVRKSLGTSSTVINITISLYLFTLGIAPMVWAALSERYGRRFVYIGATFVYTGSTIGCGWMKHISGFIVLRVLQATGASAAQAVGAGTITDLFETHERGNAMGLFFLGPLIGPVVGPIAGGYLSEYFGWRYIFWTLAGLGGLVLLLMIFFLPETSIKTQQEDIIHTFMRPFQFCAQPVVILASLPYAMAYGFMYFIIASLPHLLKYGYGYTNSQVGLAYLANGAGNVLGAVISGRYADWLLARHPTGGPERRISAIWIGIILFPVGELIYGWCFQFQTSIVGGFVGLFLLGFGVGMIQTPGNTYLVDAYPGFSASVMSAANLLRCIWGGCTPLFAPALLQAIGNGWSMTILATASIAQGVCAYLVQRYGEAWRKSLSVDV